MLFCVYCTAHTGMKYTRTHTLARVNHKPRQCREELVWCMQASGSLSHRRLNSSVLAASISLFMNLVISVRVWELKSRSCNCVCGDYEQVIAVASRDEDEGEGEGQDKRWQRKIKPTLRLITSVSNILWMSMHGLLCAHARYSTHPSRVQQSQTGRLKETATETRAY